MLDNPTQITISKETLRLVDALADAFQVPEAFNGEYDDEARDQAIRAIFEKALRDSGNEHLLTTK